jgi:beta-glucosidase
MLNRSVKQYSAAARVSACSSRSRHILRSVKSFPADFVWGAATAAYQIEGAVSEDGRGESIWDRFSHTPGTVASGDTGDVADDHYHRWRGDVGLMQSLGLKAYRFSIAWSRIFPNGTGAVNPAGLDFYDHLVDGLLEAGIQPFITLYHWDLPQALQDQGGWANPASVDAFADYADTVASRLGDRVHHWITHNEPWVVAFVGNYQGRHAPGVKDLPTALRVAHNLLLSHGRAVPRIRAASPHAQVGITLNFSTSRPATASAEDTHATSLHDQYLNRWFLDPVFGHGYPAEMAQRFGDRFAASTAQDLAEIATPIDFLGVNYYFPNFVRQSTAELGFEALPQADLAGRGYELTAMGWPVVPDAFHELLSRIHRDYQPKTMYVTENGAAFDDQPAGGRVPDVRRTAYLHGHLGAVHQAIAEGAPIQGYFVWSLLDNFEWALGYSKRFGVIYVDYATQARLIKDSGHWFQTIATTNQLPDL